MILSVKALTKAKAREKKGARSICTTTKEAR